MPPGVAGAKAATEPARIDAIASFIVDMNSLPIGCLFLYWYERSSVCVGDDGVLVGGESFFQCVNDMTSSGRIFAKQLVFYSIVSYDSTPFSI